MSSLEQLIILIVAVYLFECIVAVRRDALWFWSAGFGGYRITRGTSLPGPQERGLTLGWPLPPLRPGFLVQFWPFSISAEGVSSRRAQHVGAAEFASEPARAAAWTELAPVRAEEDRLVLGPDWIVPCASAASAHAHAELLNRLRSAPPAERSGLIAQVIGLAHSAPAAQRRLRVALGRTRTLRLACNLLVFYLVIAAPLFAWRSGLGSWPVLLGILIVLWLLVTVEFNLAHRRLAPLERAQRHKRTVVAALLPLAAARSYDVAVRERLAAFSPAAVAAALLSPERRAELLREVLCDLRHPCRNPAADADSVPERIAAEMRSMILPPVERLVRGQGLDVAALLAPPVQEDATCRCYCPRCRGQFIQDGGDCPHCPGVGLVSFGPAALEEELA